MYISNKKVLLVALATLFGLLFMFHNPHKIELGQRVQNKYLS